jgi:amino acid adenylation domain-containing protein/non-ribosomal peptide synthase protein (TIGR01720 family)
VPEGAATAPRTAEEETLSRVWRVVLRLDRVGVHDDFFRLGGDSILSLQIVVKAREEGLHVTPKQLFENPTIAALATVATPLAEPVVETGAAEGEAPLTPIQHFFFESGGPDLHWFNQALLLKVRERTAPAALARAAAALVAAHGALRLRFDGARRAAVAPAGGEAPLLWVDLSALPAEARSRAMETASAELQKGFDLARGPLFLAALFDPGRLLLAAHHLAVDAVSWRVLLADLETACRQIEAGEPVRLPAPTLSWRRWAERLARYARSSEVLAELPLWLDAPAVRPLPVDFPGGENTAGSAASVSLAFPPEATEALLREAPRAYNTRVDDLLLTALVRAFARWTGEPRLRLDLEAHGREEIVPGIDLSRTAGWFTAVHPVTLDLAGASSPGEAILAVKEQLRAIPRRGIGYGLLRWLGEDATRERLVALPEPEVAFNNLGQLDQSLGGGSRFAPAPESTGPSQSPRARRSHLVEVNALVLDGRLRVDWNYSANLHAAETIERLAAGFRAELEGLTAHCLLPEAGGFSPSDFPLARLDREALGAATGGDRSIEDLYPLAPLQRGMLLHGIWAPDSSLYLEQLDCDLAGPLDVSAFTRAWQRVVDRHAALRTAFVWRGLPEPLQIVRREVELPWIFEDFRDLPAPDERVRAWIAEDATRVFDLTRPPLLRAALLRTGEDRVRFVWTFHHLLFDGWCFALLFREVFAFYEAFHRGEDLRLPEPRPYRNYIAWLAQRPSGDTEAYWRGVLAGFESATPLPLDTPGAPPPAHPVLRERDLVLSPASTAALKACAQGRRLTVNTLVQAAWGLLLSRMADRRDVVFGTVVSGRPPELPGVESMVGLFINTLPARMDVDLEAPVAAWLRQIQEDQVAMRQHEWGTLTDVQGWSGLPPGEPLFHSILAFENYPVDNSLGEGAGELAIHDVVISDRTDYPLALAAIPGETELAFRLSHDHRTDSSTVRRLLGHLETLLAGLAAHPERRLGEVPILTKPEHGQLLAWSTGERAPLGTCLHQLFEAQVERAPDAVALADDFGETTYAELERRANRLANTLRGLGVGPEVRVGLRVSRSAEMVKAILGILKAGGAYVPVDPETPAERVALLLKDAPVVVTESSFPGPSTSGKTLFLDDPAWLTAPDVRPASGVTPENLAYVIHTSGSTGLPKGVMVRHRSATVLTQVMEPVYGIGPGDRTLGFCSISFDVSVEEIFTTLGTGATLVVRTGVDDAATFLGRCRAQRLTHLSLPTAYWHQVAAEVETGGAELHPDLRLVITGGERALAERWAAWGRGPGEQVRLVNVYGPTEATIAATIHVHPGTEEAMPREVPIGRPLPGVAAHVLGRDLRPVPVSALGELCLGGGCLARGYLDRPDLTAEKFVPDPFGEAGARLYRTGDLVRRLPDGILEFVGRVDSQVKVRGFRIELGEVEAALSAHPGVKEAVATTREDTSGNRRLVAFAVPKVPGDPLSGLRPFLAGRLPAHMVPSDLGVLDALPLTPAGKLDRRALDAIGILRGPETGFVAPRNPIEEALAAIWSELLGVERVSVDDDFFTLGGHSLVATQLVSRIRRQLGVEIPLHQLFELRTLGDLAREVLARTLADSDGMESLMGELDGLSDEEALALLGKEEA